MNNPVLMFLLSFTVRRKRASLYTVKEGKKKKKMDYPSKAKGSNVRDFFTAKNTVVLSCAGAHTHLLFIISWCFLECPWWRRRR
jgi:hypothetical protein